MAITTTKTARDLTAELAFLTRALKAPSLREAAGRLAERARAEGWSHEEFLAGCLQREVAARESHGGIRRSPHTKDEATTPQMREWLDPSPLGPPSMHRGLLAASRLAASAG